MRTIFLSMSFRPEDEKTRTFADNVGRLLQSHNISYDSGRNLGERLTPMIKRKIAEADGLIALMSRRDQLVSEAGSGPVKYSTSAWVRDEIAHARTLRKPSVALVEEGVAIDGMEADYEYIPWDPAAPLEAVLRLSATLRAWKDRAGRLRTMTARLQPPEAAALAVSDHAARVRYQVVDGGRRSKRRTAELLRATEGVIFHFDVLSEKAEILVELETGAGIWRSDLEREMMTITLKKQD